MVDLRHDDLQGRPQLVNLDEEDEGDIGYFGDEVDDVQDVPIEQPKRMDHLIKKPLNAADKLNSTDVIQPFKNPFKQKKSSHGDIA